MTKALLHFSNIISLLTTQEVTTITTVTTRTTTNPDLAYPWIVDSRQTSLRFVQDEEGCQVGSVRGHDDHGEAGPHHAQHTS